MTPRPLAGRAALITGSTAGLGLAIAAALAADGCAVTLHGLLPDAEGAAIAAGLPAPGRYLRADLTSPDAIAALVAAVAPDILVNNAVTRHFGPVEATDPAGWDEDLAVNLSAAFHAIRHALPGMRARGYGRIINMGSIFGLIGTTDRVGYVTTKHALIGLTRAVALETARDRDLTCNALCPASVPTPAIEDRIARGMASRGETSRDAAVEAFLAGKQPSGRFIAAERVAALAAFLCGPAGADITGGALPLDGGWSAG
ncbi:MAG: SDR family oxidoreductase [Acetobacteraceae bacterium]|nr:SDR family oxidoreductase [Acetobacteraceae bacterium]